MPTVRDVLIALEGVAPRRFAFSFDKVGLQVGSPEQVVTKGVVSLDRSLGAVDFAIKKGAQLLLSHHPLIFQPMDTVDTRSHQGRTVVKLIQNGMSFIAAHTNWDSAQGGINDTLCEMFALQAVASFGSGAAVSQIKMVITCPQGDVDRIIDAASGAGAGVIGAYSRCAHVVLGQGTFFGDEASKPAVGASGRQETVDEARIEMILPTDKATIVERAVRKAHPYEEPALDLFTLRDRREQPAGRIGALTQPIRLDDFSAMVDQFLKVRSWTWGAPEKLVKKAAFVGGAADAEWMDAQRAGADVLVTGEVKQHIALEASESGMCLIAAGHYQTEQPGSVRLRDRMELALPEIEWLTFNPPPGLHGRGF